MYRVRADDQANMKLGAAFILTVVLVVPACKVTDPLYCDDNTPCVDPERPYCDDNGEYPASEGIKHTCIPEPFSSDGGPTDDGGDVGRTIVQLDTAAFASCAVLSDGGLRCWGNLQNGDELVGDNEYPKEAGDIPTDGPVAQAAIGDQHICIRYTAGNVRCWGPNLSGFLGYGHQEPVVGPPADVPDIELGEPASQLTCGVNHCCALLESGEVRCWGNNTVGQLGLGHTETVGDNEVPTDADLVNVGGVVLQIVAGSAHTCVVLEGGLLRCWGQNGTAGKLGYGYESNVGDTETPVDAGYVNAGGDVIAVAPGWDHTCAILDGGSVRCWGSHLRLGIPGNDNDIGDSEEPASSGTTDVGGPARQVVAGEYFTCIARGDDQVVCWGGANSGQLGYAMPGDNVGDDETPAQQGPVMLGGAVDRLSTGTGNRNHSCALLQSGDVRCWGENGTAQLGLRHLEDIGDNETPASQDPVQVLD